MSTPTTTAGRHRAPGRKPSPRPRPDAADTETLGRGVPRPDAAPRTEIAPGSPAQDEPRGIEHARLVPILARVTIAGGALLIGAAGTLGAIPPHRWPQVTLALAYAAAAGISLLVGAGLSWAALTRESPADN